MKALLLWFVLGQALVAGHAFLPGTVVKLVHPDLIPVYASGVVEGGELTFSHALEPETEVRLLILPPDASERQAAAAVAEAPYGRIGPTGDDIFVRFEGAERAVSLKKWLLDAYGIELHFAPREGR
jgi:hypothetical protein